VNLQSRFPNEKHASAFCFSALFLFFPSSGCVTTRSSPSTISASQFPARSTSLKISQHAVCSKIHRRQAILPSQFPGKSLRSSPHQRYHSTGVYEELSTYGRSSFRYASAMGIGRSVYVTTCQFFQAYRPFSCAGPAGCTGRAGCSSLSRPILTLRRPPRNWMSCFSFVKVVMHRSARESGFSGSLRASHGHTYTQSGTAD
jgi:hypothetical protein